MSSESSSYPHGVVLESQACPLGCEANDAFVLEGRDRIHNVPGRFNVVRCRTCTLMRTNPRPTSQSIGAYYPDDYAPYHTSASNPAVAVSRTTLKSRVNRWLGMESRVLPVMTPGKMLEIGCASGAFLEQMRTNGWRTVGIEFSESATRAARAKGFEVHNGSVESAPELGEPVDLIAAWMVLEHLHDPIGVLRRLRTWIKPDGYLVASVPAANGSIRCFGNASYDLHLPNHLYHFSRSTLTAVLEESGWRVEKVRWQRNPITLLRSLEYWAGDRGVSRLVVALRWLVASKHAKYFRFFLGWVLGLTRTSGRMEIWARPSK
jgi:SAM-dependent methyltransferase